MATLSKNQQPSGVILVDITYADTGTITIGNLPPNASIIDFKVSNTTAWAGAATSSMTIGYGAFGTTVADVDAFETAIDLKATGEITLTKLLQGSVISSTQNVPLTISITNSATGASAGVGTVIVQFAQRS